jgi:NitT/TauT family transport system substrate-binding protein
MAEPKRSLGSRLSRRQALQRAGLLASGVALGQLGVACGGSSSTTKSVPVAHAGLETTNLKVGVLKFADTVPFWAADQQGIFAQVGLANVQGVEMVGGTAIQPAIQSGQLDLGWASIPSVITAHTHGFDFRFFAGGSAVGPGHYRNESMLVKRGSSIRSARDLAGKTVGVNTLGNIAELEVKWWLSSQGVDPSTVKLLGLNAVGPDELPPLIEGRVDAVQINEPAVSAALKQGSVQVAGDWSFLAPKPVFLAGWVSTGKWLDSHPKTAKAFARAMSLAADWVARNRSAANKLISDKTGVPLPLINAMVSSQIKIPVTTADAQPMIVATQKFGLIDKTFSPSEIIWRGGSS